ncbi:MAG: peptidoglycan DD-metalloendopeptidase family protein [Desulfobacteraceae bacterium]|nr:peptidoglycan DD-metalloendopeptidase family protein [Desulfobacteraceae bacterium]
MIRKFVYILVLLTICGFLRPVVGFCDIGTIQVMDLNLRSGPDVDEPPIKTLEKGAEVQILDRTGKWLKVSHDGHIGFILNEDQYVRIDPGKASTATMPDEEAITGGDKPDIAGAIALNKDKIKAISKQEQKVLSEFNDADRALNRARKKVTAAESDLKKITRTIREKNEMREAVIQRIADSEAYAGERLAALYKLLWMGKAQMLVSAETMLDFFNRKNSLERIISADEKLLASLAADQEQLAELIASLETKKTEKQAVETGLKKNIAVMIQDQKRRKTILGRIRGEKSLQLAALATQINSAKELDETVETFTRVTVVPAAPEGNSKQFAELKGLLKIPVRGKIVKLFGPYRNKTFNVVNFRSGITIQSDRGEPVRAVSGGRALFTDWIKGYGNMLIIDHGDHFYTLYAHLEEVFKSKGEPVETGEVIATVGDTGSMTGPNLHFEVRHHGKPLDPMAWIQTGKRS